MAQPWYSYPVTQAHGVNGEQGVDLGTPFHTPITALYAGTVRWAGRTQWSCGSSGGEVTITCNVPGLGVMTSYYLHLDTTDVQVGDTVQAGQQIGLSGGQLAGGQWPVVNCPPSDIYSTGAHTEFGFNASWVSGPGHNVDPTFAINQAKAGTLPMTTPDGTAIAQSGSAGAGAGAITLDPTAAEVMVLQFNNLSVGAHKVITQPTGFAGICESLDEAEAWKGWNWENIPQSIGVNFSAYMIRALVMTLCVIVVALVVWSYLRGPVSSTIRLVGAARGLQGAGGAAGTGAGAAAAPSVLAEAPAALAL